MKGVAFAVLAGICFSIIGILVKLVSGSISSFTLTLFRVAIAVVVIFLAALALKKLDQIKITKEDLSMYVVFGFIGVTLNFGLYVTAFFFAPVANVVLLMYIYPVLVAVLAGIFLKEHVSKYTIIALFFSLSGALLILYQGLALEQTYLLGNLLALGSGFAVAIYILLAKYEEATHTLYNVVFWPLVFGAILLIPFSVFEGAKISLQFNTLAIILAIGITTAVGYLTYDFGLEFIDAHIIAILTMVSEIILAIVLAFIVLGETVGIHTLMGGGLIILAGIIIQKELHPKKVLKRF